MTYTRFRHSNNRFGGGRRFSGGWSRNGRRQSEFKPNAIDRSKYIAKAQAAPAEVVEVETNSYSDFELEGALKNNLAKKGYEKTTPIQSQTIPLILEGKNTLGISATGSGKTAAFLVPMVNKILKDRNQRLLVLAPTRELAMQIQKEAISLIQGTFIRADRIIGGESIGRQIMELRRNPNIIIGTPGRINDMKKRGHLNLATFNNVVLDEVDRMLDMGFVHDIKNILSMVSQERQMMFFSATIDQRVKGIINTFAPDHETISLTSNKPTHSVEQDIIEYLTREEKIGKLHDILVREEVVKSIVFIETKRYADEVERELKGRGFKVAALHGDKSQGQRTRLIRSYRENEINVLVATNVAARGLDIPDITHVINFDEPQSYDEYIHRIGRTGRNGKTGVAYTFVRKKVY